MDPSHAPLIGGGSQIYGEGMPADDAFSTLAHRVQQELERYIMQVRMLWQRPSVLVQRLCIRKTLFKLLRSSERTRTTGNDARFK